MGRTSFNWDRIILNRYPDTPWRTLQRSSSRLNIRTALASRSAWKSPSRLGSVTSPISMCAWWRPFQSTDSTVAEQPDTGHSTTPATLRRIFHLHVYGSWRTTWANRRMRPFLAVIHDALRYANVKTTDAIAGLVRRTQLLPETNGKRT